MADITLPKLRTDGAGYVEGVETAGFVINKALIQNTWLIPNVTYTPADLSDAGTMLIPTVDKLTSGAETDLCAKGTAGSVVGGYETLQITSKVSAEFEGCFEVAGIAAGKFSKALNSLKIEIMVDDYNTAMYNRALVLAKESEVEAWSGTAGDGSAVKYVLARRVEHKKLNGKNPNFALISDELAEALEADFMARNTQVGDNAILSGLQSEEDTFDWRKCTFFVRTQDEDLVFGNKATNFIGTPKTAKQLATFMPNVNMSEAGNSFSQGLISLTAVGDHMDPSSVKTGVHKPYGHAAVKDFTFTKPKAEVTESAGTPTRGNKATKEEK